MHTAFATALLRRGASSTYSTIVRYSSALPLSGRYCYPLKKTRAISTKRIFTIVMHLHDCNMARATIENLAVERPEPTAAASQGMCLDRREFSLLWPFAKTVSEL
jgi:hypothetical protein